MKSVKGIMKKAASLALVFSLAFSAFAGIAGTNRYGAWSAVKSVKAK